MVWGIWQKHCEAYLVNTLCINSQCSSLTNEISFQLWNTVTVKQSRHNDNHKNYTRKQKSMCKLCHPLSVTKCCKCLIVCILILLWMTTVQVLLQKRVLYMHGNILNIDVLKCLIWAINPRSIIYVTNMWQNNIHKYTIIWPNYIIQ